MIGMIGMLLVLTKKLSMTVKKPLIRPCTLDLLGLPLGVLAESPWPNQFATAMFFLCYLWLHHFPSLGWPHVSWETTIQTMRRSQECWWNIPTTITMVEYLWISLPTFFSPNLVCNPTQSLEADTCYSSTSVWKSVVFCTWQKMLKIYDLNSATLYKRRSVCSIGFLVILGVPTNRQRIPVHTMPGGFGRVTGSAIPKTL